MSKYFLSLTILLSNIFCYKNSRIEVIDTFDEKYPDVDEALWSYFINFEKEANIRGLTIDLSRAGISATFGNLPDDRVAGQCSYNHLNPGHITIDTHFRIDASELNRKMIKFNELGHCCYCQDAYPPANRAYYLDELFAVQ